MPKLSPDFVKKADTADTEGRNFDPIPEGPYTLRLTEVEATTSKTTQKPMWVWKWEVAEGEHEGYSLFDRTVIQENMMWKIAQIFAAFGVPNDTHTDNLIGQGRSVVATVKQEVIQSGNRKGQLSNSVDRYLPSETPAPSGEAKKDDLPF